MKHVPTIPEPSRATPISSSTDRQLAVEILAELVGIDTTHVTGSTTDAAEAVARRLLHAGFPAEDVSVLGPHPARGNLVARLRGTGRARPLVLLAHLDVVPADPDEWSSDPFTLVERDGHFHGRGTVDDKGMAAIWSALLIGFRRTGVALDRDLILVLTADEEGGEHNGAEWLLREHRELVDAEFGLNEGGYGRVRHGRRIANVVQAGEKTYLDLEIVARRRGGHSSLPLPDSAILALAEGVTRLAGLELPITLGPVTRAFFARMAEIESGQVAADMRAILRTPPGPAALERLTSDPYYNALLRNTLAVTRLDAGEENNTIPTTARAVVNCRILPEQSASDMERMIAGILDDLELRVRPLEQAIGSPASPLTPTIMRPVERITAAMWPGVPVLPVMGIGGTDSRHFRRSGIPMYGVSGIFLDMDDVRVHAADERIGVQAFHEGLEFLHRLLRDLAQSSAVSDAGSEA